MLCREKLAFVVAPLFPSIFLLLVFRVADIRLAAFFLLFSIPFSYLPCLLLGIPLTRCLGRRKSLTVITVTLCGMLFGVLVYYGAGFAIATVLGSQKYFVPTLMDWAPGALFGFLVALPFSLISGFPLSSPKR